MNNLRRLVSYLRTGARRREWPRWLPTVVNLGPDSRQVSVCWRGVAPRVVAVNGRVIPTSQILIKSTAFNAVLRLPSKDVIPGDNIVALPISTIDARVSELDSADTSDRAARFEASSLRTAILRFETSAQIDPQARRFGGCFQGAFAPVTGRWHIGFWPWAGGAAVAHLRQQADCSDYGVVAARAVDAFIGSQLEGGPDSGAMLARLDPDAFGASGLAEWYAPNDAASFMGNALAPERDPPAQKELAAAGVLAEWIARRGLDEDYCPYIGLRGESKTWEKRYQYVDVSFTPALYSVLAHRTNDEKLLETGMLIARGVLKRFELGAGRLAKEVEGRRVMRVNFSRGYGWLIEGVGAVALQTRDARLVEALRRVVGFVLRHQTKDGAWYYRMDDSSSGECAKATALLALQLNRLLPLGLHPDVEGAALRALRWCVRRMKTPAGSFVGYLSGRTIEGGIVAARGFEELAMVYSSAHVGIALHELAADGDDLW